MTAPTDLERPALPIAGGGGLAPRRVVTAWLAATVGTALLTAVMAPLHTGPSPSYESMLYLGLAVTCALVGGRAPALVASVAGALALNFFFVAPVHTLRIASGQNVATLAFFVLVAVAVAAVVDSAARRRDEAELARAEARTLGMLNATVLGGAYDVPQLVELLRETLGADSAMLVPRGGQVAAGPGTVVAEAGQGSQLVLRGARVGDVERRVLSAFARHVGVLREREELARQTRAAHQLEAGNRTRAALLAAVSHDLRTPLAGIRVATETLRSAPLRPGDREVLLDSVAESTARLTRIVTDLLDMSRLQAGAVSARTAPVSLEAVLIEVRDALPDGGRVTLAEDLPEVKADEALLARVLENLVANALRHGGPTSVTVQAARDSARVEVRVVDHGPGVAPERRSEMFAPFQRLGDAGREGTGVGLGLAVARGLSEAQGGTLEAVDTPGGGLTMVLVLPAVDLGETT